MIYDRSDIEETGNRKVGKLGPTNPDVVYGVTGVRILGALMIVTGFALLPDVSAAFMFGAALVFLIVGYQRT